MAEYEIPTPCSEPEETGVCALVRDMLPFYSDGEGSTEARAFIETHLDRCRACAHFLAGAQSVRDQIRRESRQRSSVIGNDQHARQAIASGQRAIVLRLLFITLLMALLVVVIGIVASAVIGSVASNV